MIYVIVGIMFFMVINRYVWVIRFELFKKIFILRKFFMVMIIVWVFFVLMLLLIVFEDGFVFNVNYVVCVFLFKYKVYIMVFFGVFIIFFFLVVFFSYCRVF